MGPKLIGEGFICLDGSFVGKVDRGARGYALCKGVGADPMFKGNGHGFSQREHLDLIHSDYQEQRNVNSQARSGHCFFLFFFSAGGLLKVALSADMFGLFWSVRCHGMFMFLGKFQRSHYNLTIGDG